MRTKVKYAWIAFCAVLAMSLMLGGSALQVPSGTWQATGSMSQVRDGAAAVALQDGRVLVIGGDSGSGPTASVDIFSATGVFPAGAPMSTARSGHVAVRLSDGRVLVAGGTTVGGSATNSAEIYDPASDSWSNAASLSEARSGAVAVALENSRVMVAGGAGVKSIEIYDEASDSWWTAGDMSKARANAAATTLGRWPTESNRLIDRQVIIVGGSNGGAVLASTEIYDPKTGSISAGPSLPGPRQNASAVTVLGGYAYVAGGNDGQNDLSSAVLISRDGAVSAAPDLLAARSGHVAVRLSGNNSVLIAGGSSGSSAELFIPWLNQQVATGFMTEAGRIGAVGASAGRGLYVVAGGSGSSSSEVYGYATIDTDKNDYKPGETVYASGSGWTAGEIVTGVLHEDLASPLHPDIPVTLVADGNGDIPPTPVYLVEDHDIGVRFFLTVSGAASGHQARATFTDAPSADIDQCRNGDSSPITSVACKDSTGGWVNGNAGEQNSHYAEGLSLPYRVRLEQVPQGEEIDIWLSYDTKHSNRVAIDHLTSYQCLDPHLQFGHTAEVVDPGDTFGGYTGLAPTDTEPIPNPTFPGAPNDAPGFPNFPGSLNDCTRNMSIWGGTITGIAYNPVGLTSGSGEGVYTDGVNQSTTVIRVRFMPSSQNVLLGWGGHIASRVDWGFDVNGSPRSAGGISGSPYHMRLEDWRFATGDDAGDKVTNLGQQDRSLSAQAVIPIGTIKIVKNAVPNHPQDFTFSASGMGIMPTSFTLDDDGAEGNPENSMIEFTVLSGNTFTFTETNIPSGWQLAQRGCNQTAQGLQPFQQSIITFPGSDQIVIELKDGESFTCTFDNNGSGHIIVDKVTDPSGDAQVFDFVAGGGLYTDFSLDDDDTPNDQLLIPGLYSVSETVPVGWDLISSTCVSSIGDTETAGNLELDAAETITCTFTNRKRGSIKIIKNAIPDDVQNFAYTSTSDQTTTIGSFNLDDDGLGGGDAACTGGNCLMMQTFSNLKAGDYSVTEGDVANWALTDLSCTASDGSSGAQDGDDPTALITLAAGGSVECTFENTKNGKIIVEKQTIPDGATTSFTFSGDVAGSIEDDGMLMESVAPGSYDSTETVPAGWTLKGIECDDSDSAVDGTIEEQANFVVDPGEIVTCVFTNIKNPNIRITPDGTNEVGDPHIFTVKVFQNAGNGEEGIAGVFPVVTFSPSDPGTINDLCDAPDGTNGSGECTVTINSNVAGVFTAHASAEVTIMGVVFNIGTDDANGNSDDAVKTYVDASILVEGDDVNRVGEQHTFTVTVLANDGGGNDPVEGATPTVTITPAGFTLVADNCDGVGDTGTNASGQCTVVINSNVTGIFNADASVTILVGGVSLTRDTAGNSGPDGNDGATKRYIDAKISIDPQNDTNRVNDQHKFTVSVLVDEGEGGGFLPFEGALVDIVVSPPPDSLLEDDCNDGTAADGTCMAFINSSVTGVFTARARSEITIDGVTMQLQTNGLNGSSGPATKKYIDARISIEQDDVNAVNDPHTFTITVEVDDADGNGFEGFGGALVDVVVSPPPDGGLQEADCNDGTASNGTCLATINSSVPGVFTARARSEIVVDGVTMQLQTNGLNGSSDPAVKRYVKARISINPPEFTNQVDEPHTFTVKVEQDIGDGSGYQPVENAPVDVVVTPPPDGGLNETDCNNGTDANGECEASINSSVAGQFTAIARSLLLVEGVEFKLQTNGSGDNSGPAHKTYVDAKISIDPQRAANAVGDRHTLTATVMEDDGNGFDAAANEIVTFMVTAGDATFVDDGVDSDGDMNEGNDCVTDVNGMCSVQINDSTPGSNTIKASVDANVLTEVVHRETDGTHGSSGPAIKVYVDAQIDITPPSDTNRVGDPHVFTATVLQNTGSGFVAVPDGTTINFKLVNSNGATAEFQPDPPGGEEFQCLTSGGTGSCQATIVSPTTGVVTVAARSVILVEGVEFKLQTNGVGNNSAPAIKTYVDARISINPPEDTNPINEEHKFTVLVEADSGNGGGFQPFLGALVDVAVTPPPDSLLEDDCNDGTAADGTCMAFINSATPGTFTAFARSEIIVGGVTFQLVTNGQGNNSGPGIKHYVAGKIIVVKTCEPQFDEQLFTFSGPGAINQAQLACFTNGNTNTVDSGFLAPGNYQTEEVNIPEGWDLDSVTCDDDDGSDPRANPTDLVLQANETITCTYHNVKRAKLVLRKINLGRGPAFPIFTYSGSPALPDAMAGSIGIVNNAPVDFSLQTQPMNQDPNEQCLGIFNASQFATAECKGEAMVSNVAPGQQAFFEAQPNSLTWRLIELVCDDPDAVTSINDTDGVVNGTPAKGGRVDIDLEPGQTLTCTFVNQFGGRIRVVKQTDPADSSQEFHYDTNYLNPGPGSFDLTDADAGDGNDTDINTAPPSPNNLSDWQPPNPDSDHYMVTETVPSGWDLTGISCYIESGPNAGASVGVVDLGNGKVTVPLSGGQIIRCTFSNTERGKITVRKQISFGDLTAVFPFDASGGSDPAYADFNLMDGEMNMQVLKPGSYSAQELVSQVQGGTWEIDFINHPADAIACTADGGSSFTITGASVNPTDAYQKGDDNVDITLGAAGNVDCTFINRSGGKIRIIKACLPDPDDPTNGMFNFTSTYVNGDTTPGPLECSGTDSTTNNAVNDTLSLWQPVFDNTNGTTYTVGENLADLATLAPGYSLSGISCVVEADAANPQNVGLPVGSVDLVAGDVDLPLFGGQILACTFTNTLQGFEGCTLGFWKNHLLAWGPTGYLPTQTIGSVFTVPAVMNGVYVINGKSLAANTLLEGLNMKGGSGLNGGAGILMKQAVAALLNAAHPGVNSPNSVADVIADTNAALASHDRAILVAQGGEFGADNELENCNIGGPGSRGEDSPVTEPTTPTTTPTTSEPAVSQPASKPVSATDNPVGLGFGVIPTAEGESANEPIAQSQITSLKLAEGQAEVSGLVVDETGKPLTGVVGITFALYSDREGGSPVWLETRNVELDEEGRYTVRITLPTGLGSLESHWLGVQVLGQAEQLRLVLR